MQILRGFYPPPGKRQVGAQPHTMFWGCIALLAIALPQAAAAHPHVYMENSLQIVFDGTGMTGIKVRWLFDDMFSSTMREAYDSNKDGRFSAAEVEALRSGAFTNLKNYHYFTYITIGTKTFDVTYVKEFHAVVQNNNMVYTFFIPCHVKAVPTPKTVTIAVYDKTYYADILLVKHQCDHSAAPGVVTSNSKEVANTSKSFYFGQITPVELLVTFNKAAP
jgi:ABC-type uncharacterized transport system substrate-binding protein